MFNKPASQVTLGTTLPDLIVPVPALNGIDDMHRDIPVGFQTALSLAATSTAGGASAPSTALVVSLLYG